MRSINRLCLTEMDIHVVCGATPRTQQRPSWHALCQLFYGCDETPQSKGQLGRKGFIWHGSLSVKSEQELKSGDADTVSFLWPRNHSELRLRGVNFRQDLGRRRSEIHSFISQTLVTLIKQRLIGLDQEHTIHVSLCSGSLSSGTSSSSAMDEI